MLWAGHGRPANGPNEAGPKKAAGINWILIIGTAGQGPVNTPYQVTDRALAAQTFGFSGSLERSIEAPQKAFIMPRLVAILSFPCW
jgi:hypothetical protein